MLKYLSVTQSKLGSSAVPSVSNPRFGCSATGIYKFNISIF